MQDKILKILEEQGNIRAKNGHLKPGLVNAVMLPFFEEIEKLRQSGLSMNYIYQYYRSENKIPDFIQYKALCKWFKTHQQELQALKATAQSNLVSAQAPRPLSTRPPDDTVTTTASPASPVLSLNDSLQSSLELFENTDEKNWLGLLSKFPDQLAYIKTLLLFLNSRNVLSEYCCYYRDFFNLIITRSGKSTELADTSEKTVEVLPEAAAREYTWRPSSLKVLNPLSPRYPFITPVNWLLYDENGIVYEAKKQLPIPIVCTLKCRQYENIEKFTYVIPENFGKSFFAEKLQDILSNEFINTGNFMPVVKLLDA